MQDTIIAWTDATWNPTFGCSKVSAGCAFCYAETIALKFGHSKSKWTIGNEKENVVLKPHKLQEPYKLKTPSRVFVNSMSDLFHAEIPDTYIKQVFDVMNDLPQHTFQILTKRPERAATWDYRWSENIWMGATIENADNLYRTDLLRECQARTKFISAEPLLGSLSGIDLTGIHWVIVGGESGFHLRQHQDREMPHQWGRELRDACLEYDAAFFFKQSSGMRTEMGTALEHEDGSFWEWRQFPDIRPFTPPQCVLPVAL